MKFNRNQSEVINYGKGTLLVEAGPGSGKTTVIVERIKKLSRIIPAESILVITFTRKAAENLKDKLRNHLSKETVSKMKISTIHSFCLEYLKSKNQFVRLLDDDTGEKKSLFIQKFLKNLGFSNANTLYPYQIDSVINKFGEFTSFSADIEGLIKHIEENSPVSEDYLNYINSLGYFSKKRK